MIDVFISYARSRPQEAEAVTAALRALGYVVWRDDELPTHRAYSEVIEERLAEAKAVVVIWSAEAAKSQWVFSEANHAREAGKLVQLTIDGARLPMPFDSIHCADLSGWSGDIETPAWRRTLTSVAELVGAAAAPAQAAQAQDPGALPKLPSGPSIAVVPFANLSNDPEQEYFVDGMVEEIVSALARFKSLFVVSAGHSLMVAGQAVSPQDAARRLGVRYVLEGSVRKAAGRVRVAVHLIDTANAIEVWADRMDETMDDVFALQDRVAARIAGVVENTLQDAGMRDIAARPTSNTDSYDLYLRANMLFRMSRKAEMLKSIELLEQAISLDPAYALALSQLSVCHRQMLDHGWADDPAAMRRQGLAYAEQALRLGNDNARVIAQVAAGLPGLDGNTTRALALADRAIALNPASAFVWLLSGSIQLRAGDPDRAAEHLETALRLDPISNLANGFGRMYLASCRFQQGRFEEALQLFGTTSLRLPISYAILASLNGHLGRLAEAREDLALFRANHFGTIEDVARIWFPRAQYRKLFLDGIAMAERGGA